MSIKSESLFTGISTLETFLSKIHSSELISSILYENGSLIVKLKHGRLDDYEQTQQFFQLMNSYPELTKYMKRIPVDAYKDNIVSFSGAKYHLRLDKIKAANLMENLDTLVSALKKTNDVEVSRNSKEVIINILVMGDPPKATQFVKFFFPLVDKLKLKFYLDLEATEPSTTQIYRFGSLEIHIDIMAFLTNYHTARLQSYYSSSKEDLVKSMNFLLGLGWDEKQFNSIGVSRATYYRLKQENNQSQLRQKQN